MGSSDGSISRTWLSWARVSANLTSDMPCCWYWAIMLSMNCVKKSFIWVKTLTSRTT